MERAKICVVGACNLDLISYVPRLPSMGETLHGIVFTWDLEARVPTRR
jgi:ribokinase